MIYFAQPILKLEWLNLICGKTTIIYDPANLRIPNTWNISEELRLLWIYIIWIKRVQWFWQR